jgi:flavin reductase (DIM6/NTAB) family NADH-FMN oxidoreductase RutF
MVSSVRSDPMAPLSSFLMAILFTSPTMVSWTPDEVPVRDRYHLMTATILPRPIAWITSLDAEGGLNVAPFSYFSGVSAEPPLVSTSIGARRDGSPKHTLRNIEARREYVIHVVDEAHAHQMVETAGIHPPGEPKTDVVGLDTVPSVDVSVPRLAKAPIAVECVLHDLYAPPGSTTRLVIGRILRWHVRDNLVIHDEETGQDRVDVHRLRPLGRLGYDQYCPVREVFEMRPPR